MESQESAELYADQERKKEVKVVVWNIFIATR